MWREAWDGVVDMMKALGSQWRAVLPRKKRYSDRHGCHDGTPALLNQLSDLPMAIWWNYIAHLSYKFGWIEKLPVIQLNRMPFCLWLLVVQTKIHQFPIPNPRQHRNSESSVQTTFDSEGFFKANIGTTICPICLQEGSKCMSSCLRDFLLGELPSFCR